ncbi:PAS domain S-box protein [Sphingomonas montana]|uniref:PAS domain S-box protein n=1 Tax=Sphingomonas montana TaxID=1843236 RepID=UPI00096E8743|nr:PAS domain S-box protein [Sphingomonas montana]
MTDGGQIDAGTKDGWWHAPRPDDAGRVAALAACGILDTPPERDFDDLAALAADICDTPIALVSFVENERQWFKATIGVDVRETAAGGSFCIHAIAADDFLMIPDTAADPRFVGNPLVTQVGLRFYAGMPLRTADGHVVGTICVLDRRPRTLDPVQVRALERLARQVMRLIDLRRTLRTQTEADVRFRNMADHAPVMMWVTDADGRCTYLNRRWYDHTGQTVEESLGFGWLDATHPDDRAIAERTFLDANGARVPFRVDYRLRRADGQYRWAIDAAAPRFDADGVWLGYVGSVIDIDERREAEQALRDSEAYVRLLLDSTAEGFYAVDTEGRTTLCNPAFLSMLGFDSESAVIGERLHDIIHHHHADGRPYPVADCPISRCAREGHAAQVLDEVFFRCDGTALPVEYRAHPIVRDGRVEGAVCTFADVTARRAAEAALRESEANLRALNTDLERRVIDRAQQRGRTWAVTPDLLSVVDAQGLFEAVNPAWTLLLGWKEADLVGRNAFDLVHPDDVDGSRAILATMKDDRPLAGYENRQRHRDGGYRWLSWTVVPEDGRYYCIARDVTRDKARQAELEQAQDALRQSQKLEAMGQLTGGVAHDFNNLLTPIIGGLDMLQRHGFGTPRQQRLIGGAMQSAERAQMLVQRLLAFARRQPLQTAAIDIGALVDGMVDLIASTSGPQVRVLVDVAGDIPTATADANQVEMAILNLAVNARDAMPDGGTLTIAAAAETVRSGHRSGLPPADYVRLSVSDTGTGMDDATIARAIEPFFSTKGIGKGTGLGLSMVHGLAAQLGGALTIASRRGLGTRIELWLPISGSALPTAATPQAMLHTTTTGTALVIDDEDYVRLSTADMLSDLGYDVTEAASAEEGLALLDTGRSIDLVVTDHLMPGMTGVALARTVRVRWPDLPVLIVSGYADVESLDSDLPRLAKPFRQADLASAVAALRR